MRMGMGVPLLQQVTTRKTTARKMNICRDLKMKRKKQSQSRYSKAKNFGKILMGMLKSIAVFWNSGTTFGKSRTRM